MYTYKLYYCRMEKPVKEQIMCFSCKKKTNNLEMEIIIDPSTGKRRAKAYCEICKKEKSMFLN